MVIDQKNKSYNDCFAKVGDTARGTVASSYSILLYQGPLFSIEGLIIDYSVLL